MPVRPAPPRKRTDGRQVLSGWRAPLFGTHADQLARSKMMVAAVDRCHERVRRAVRSAPCRSCPTRRSSSMLKSMPARGDERLDITQLLDIASDCPSHRPRHRNRETDGPSISSSLPFRPIHVCAALRAARASSAKTTAVSSVGKKPGPMALVLSADLDSGGRMQIDGSRVPSLPPTLSHCVSCQSSGVISSCWRIGREVRIPDAASHMSIWSPVDPRQPSFPARSVPLSIISRMKFGTWLLAMNRSSAP